MVTTEEPILSRIDRLDNMLRQLEEIRGCNRSPKSSYCSTPTSGSGRVSSVDFSPKSLEKHCRPIDNVLMETEVKGTLIERLNQIEDRMLKLEEEWEADRKKEEKMVNSPKKKGFKQLVKQCVKARSGKHDN
ncbi:hypothetical protein RIF29_13635 [Crotalaria pallida]|uniref:Uncharacterized protein n=1 Tax=Crotalaria pallida TaxID=3830 RepID=A0AAN9IPJ1_CROPI